MTTHPRIRLDHAAPFPSTHYSHVTPSPSRSIERLATGEAHIIVLNPQPHRRACNCDLGQIVYSQSRCHHPRPISSLLLPSLLDWPTHDRLPLSLSWSTSLFSSIAHSFFLPLLVWLRITVFDEWFFVLSFVFLHLYIEIFYYKICLEVEKMCKLVENEHFQNETKHLKIFSKAIFKMQPNNWKYFPFPKIFSLENILHSENILHVAKCSLIGPFSTNKSLNFVSIFFHWHGS